MRAEIEALDGQASSLLRSTTQFTTISITVIFGAFGIAAERNAGLAAIVATLLLGGVAAIYANSSADAAALGARRDILADELNHHFNSAVFTAGIIGQKARFSVGSLSANAIPVLLLLGSWALSLAINWSNPPLRALAFGAIGLVAVAVLAGVMRMARASKQAMLAVLEYSENLADARLEAVRAEARDARS